MQRTCRPSGGSVSHETVRRWTLRFAAAYARRIPERRPRPTGRWHLDEVFIRIRGRIHYLWRAVDDEGEVLEVIVQFPARSEGGAEAAARTAQTAGVHARRDRHRPTSLLRRGVAGSRPCRPPGDRWPIERPGRGLAPAHTATGATQAWFPLTRLGPALPLASRRHLQPFQLPTSPDLLPKDEEAPRGCLRVLARNRRRLRL